MNKSIDKLGKVFNVSNLLASAKGTETIRACRRSWAHRAPPTIPEGGHTSGNRTYINPEISDTSGRGILTKIYPRSFEEGVKVSYTAKLEVPILVPPKTKT